MAISLANLTFGSDGTNQAAYATASVTPGANRLILLATYGQRSDTNPHVAPAVSGCGLTWVEVLSIAGPTGNLSRGLSVLRAMGAPTPGAITITWPIDQTFCYWSVSEATGVDTSGTNGSGAVRQSASAEGTAVTSLAVALSAFGDAVNNVTYAVMAHHAAEATAPEAGYTELSDEFVTYEFGRGFASAWRLGEDLSPSMSWVSAVQCLGVAIEIVAAPPPSTYRIIRSPLVWRT